MARPSSGVRLMTISPAVITPRPSVTWGPAITRRGTGLVATGKSVHITIGAVNVRDPVTSVDWAKTGAADSTNAAAITRVRSISGLLSGGSPAFRERFGGSYRMFRT